MKNLRIVFLSIVFLSVSVFILKHQQNVSGAAQTLKVESVQIMETAQLSGKNINLKNAVTVASEFSATPEILTLLQNSQPLTMASGDFDSDGTADLLSGFSNGILTLHRGNEASIFPAGRDARGEQISPFFPDATIFQIEEKPDFIAVGDFNNDTFTDFVTAQKDGENLHFFKGNGRGNFAEIEKIKVGGKVTALVSGNLNRDDGTEDLALAIETETGSKVLIFEGWQGALNNPKIEVFDLPKTANILQIISLNNKGFGDLVIAAENELVIIAGRDRMLTRGENVEVPPAIIKKQSFDSKIAALTVGNFTESEKTEIFVLTENNAMFSVLPATENGFTAEKVTLNANFTAKEVILNKAKVSASGSTDDLILLDRDNHQILIYGKSVLLATFTAEAIAVLPMRLNKDGLDDLVFLSKNQNTPAFSLSHPQAIFTVNSTSLEFDATPGNGVCETATGNGQCTLQAAIGETNALSGADEIRFNLPGSAPFSIALDFQFLRDITETVTLDATTQPGFSGEPIVEINGAGATLNPRALQFTRAIGGATNASNSVVRGLVINRFQGRAIDMGDFNEETNNIRIEGNYIGTNIAGTTAQGNGNGIEIQSFNHIIGGTTAAARNVISGNTQNGLLIGVSDQTAGTIIRGNFIGTDKNGTADLGNAGDGIRAGNIGGTQTTIGGTAAGASNVISGNGGSGINFNSSTGNLDGLIIEANFIGTDLTGNIDLGNDQRGVLINGYDSGTRVGGTTNAARNIISGNGKDGIELRFSQAVNVQGNFIGVKADGTTPLTNDRHGLYLTNSTSGTTFGGGTPVIGQCNAPCNVIASGTNGAWVSQRTTTPPNLTEIPTSPVGSPRDDSNLFVHFNGLRNLAQNLGIDLGDDGRTPNDPGDGDSGPNGLQNHPEVENCSSSSNAVNNLVDFQCTGNLNSNPNTDFTIDFYLNSPTNQIVASSFLGSQNVFTNASGNAPFTFNFTAAPPNGSSIMAITRRQFTPRNTSEDSPPRLLGGTPCTYQVAPTNFEIPAAGSNSRSVTILTQAGCPWTAVSEDNHITNVNPPNGVGNGIVTFNVQSNISSAPRNGILTIAGQTVLVFQEGCAYSVSPVLITFNSRGGNRLAAVMTDASTCQWTINFTNIGFSVFPTSGTGNGAILITAAQNTTADLISANLNINGRTAVNLSTIPKNAGYEYFFFDGKADLGTYGTTNNIAENLFSTVISTPNTVASWRLRDSATGNNTQTQFGLTDDKLVPGDYNGDGKADFAVFRPSTGTWFIARPTGVPAQNFDAVQFGISTDIPVPNDYDGDGKTDIAVFRPSNGTWWILRSSDGGLTVVQWGLNGDKPVSGFYDADEKADIAVWRPSDGVWYIINSSDGSFRFNQFGLSSDKPVPGDYDGDFKNDIAVFRPATGEWWILQSTDNNLRGLNWGLADDKLVPADYDGDLKTDVAVWRPSTQTWFILQSSNLTPEITQQGQSGDIPIHSALVPE